MGLLETLGLRRLDSARRPRRLLETERARAAPRPDAPAAPGATARAEADAVIAPITALADGGIRDPKLRAKIKAELTPIAAAFAKADKQKSRRGGDQGLQDAARPGGQAAGASAEQFKAVSDLKIDEWDPAAEPGEGRDRQRRLRARQGGAADLRAWASSRRPPSRSSRPAIGRRRSGTMPGLERVDTLSARLADARRRDRHRASTRSKASSPASGTASAGRSWPSASPRSRPRRRRPGPKARR